MAATLQVIYPAAEGTSFDHDYYATTHMELVGKHMGDLIQSTVVTKGLTGGPRTAPGYHAVATIIFADEASLGAALKASGPLMADIPNFTDATPQVLTGEVIG